MSASYLYFIIPIAAIVLALKCALLCWRINYYQQRRRERLAQMNVAAARAQAARNAALTRAGTASLTRIVAQGPDGRERMYIIPTNRLFTNASASTGRSPGPPNPCRTLIVTSDDLSLGRSETDPNKPPSYEQAITGQDRSVKVDEGTTTYETNDNADDDVAPLLP